MPFLNPIDYYTILPNNWVIFLFHFYGILVASQNGTAFTPLRRWVNVRFLLAQGSLLTVLNLRTFLASFLFGTNVSLQATHTFDRKLVVASRKMGLNAEKAWRLA
jgi:hypothetical protein